MPGAWDRLLGHLRTLRDLSSSIALLHWDQKVMMPPRGSESRSRSIATLEALAHQRFTSPEIGELIAQLDGVQAETHGVTQDEVAATIRILKRDYERATKLPTELVQALAEQAGKTYQAWTEARPASDFSILQPDLERLVELKKQEADALGWAAERYDALLEYYDPGMTAKQVEALFAQLVAGLKPIVEAALDKVRDKPAFLSASYDVGAQASVCRWLVERLGFDTSAGRLDVSPHPFTITVSPTDVRQTTRYDPRALLPAIYAAIHETGHALYEQGLPERFRDLPLGRVPSYGMHESQSRLWENQVGRSRPFTDFLLPQLKERFGESLGNVSPEEFNRGVNHVEHSPIRVEADELTYNLHVALRFELELAQFRDELDVADLPDAWDAAMEKHLGIRPDTQAEGVLQDMHWPAGMHAYFPSYTLGTIYSAALFDKAEQDVDDLDDRVRAGDTQPLLAWLRANVHQQAYLYEAPELMERLLGNPVTAEPLLTYLARKYASLYDFSV